MPCRDGTSHIALQPVELLEKLAALIPRPYVNLIVYHGVLAPNAKWRGEVVVFGPARVESEPSAESSVTWASLQTQSSLRRRGHPRSSTTPGLVDLRSASRVEPLDSCVRSVLITLLPALRDANMVLGPRLFAGLLAHRAHVEGPIARY